LLPSTLTRPPLSTLFPYTTLFRSSIQFFSLNALSQVEKIIRKTISTSEPAIDQPAVRSVQHAFFARPERKVAAQFRTAWNHAAEDRKSTRLNSSHRTISYAVFCLK